MKKINLTALALMIAFSSFGQKVMEKEFIGKKKLYFGAAYYPEIWTEEDINNDIKHMKELNMNVMRMAEFSWSKMEPKEGEYDFTWLRKITDKLHENGIDVILGTPTATPPAWMWEKYPEIARTGDTGLKTIHGSRKSCSYSNKKYREMCRIITEKMAEAFADAPNIIGWQTDNEFGHAPDYSEETRALWIAWLKKKYGTIEAFNKKLALDLWSQKYDRFEQVPMPVTRIWHHNSIRYDWSVFTNDMIVEFQDVQVKAIRKYSKAPITHDGMPGQSVDYEKLFKDLDYMAVNHYHSFEAYDRIVSNYDRQRGYSKGAYWLFETAPNNSGGGKKGQTWFLHQPKGSMHAIMWTCYGLGAQGAMYWLWRQHYAGQEMVHGSVISVWGKPAANYGDIKQLGSELNKCSDFLMSNPVPKADVAIMYSHKADAGFRIEEYATGLKYYNDFTYRFYHPLLKGYIHRDVIAPSHDFSSYKVLFIPIIPNLDEATKERLKAWVKAGGTLIVGPMTGYRNESWGAHTDHATGSLEDWIGITVESKIPVGIKRRPAEIPLMLNWKKDLNIGQTEAGLMSEALTTSKGQILATYETGMHDGKAAIAENKVGKGKVVYLGCDPGYEATKALLKKYTAEKGIKPLADGDEGIIVAPRGEKGKVIINLSNEEKSITLPDAEMQDLLTDKKFGGKITLAPYQVLVLKK